MYVLYNLILVDNEQTPSPLCRRHYAFGLYFMHILFKRGFRPHSPRTCLNHIQSLFEKIKRKKLYPNGTLLNNLHVEAFYTLGTNEILNSEWNQIINILLIWFLI